MYNPNSNTNLNSKNVLTNHLDVNTVFIADHLDVSAINVSSDVYLNNSTYTPVGSILTYAGMNAPPGWLLCDGSEKSRSTYSRLYAVISNLYGTPTNGNNFVLPDLKERIPVGKSTNTNVGQSGGNSSITLDVGQLPAHRHTGSVDASGGHTHTGTTAANGQHAHTGMTAPYGEHIHGITDPGHTHTQWTINDDFNNSGGSRPSFAADSAGYVTWNNIYPSQTGITINSSGNHSHPFTSDPNGSHSHTFTTDPTTNHSHTFTTDNTGNGSQIDIRNKYIVLNYIIRY